MRDAVLLDHTSQGNAFHEGERAIQRLAGVPDDRAAAAGRSLRNYMPDQHRELFARLPFIVAGALDEKGQPWATLLEGQPGFIASPDNQHLRIDTQLPELDPLASVLHPNVQIALLGIEPSTRRRNRANGTIMARTQQSLEVHVLQSFGNCPKYIQARTVQYDAGKAIDPSARRGRQLDNAARRLISAADTFFIASAYSAAPDELPSHGVDVSHRGGLPGFVHIESNTLSIADFVGNNYFNTLGNLERYPQAGLLFIDFVTGEFLHMAARTRLEWVPDSGLRDQIATNRVLHFDITDVVHVAKQSRLSWGKPSMSPFLS